MRINNKIIYTVGHSNRDLDAFLELLRIHRVQVLADVRSFPGSRKYPQFNKESMARELPGYGHNYEHIRTLGGRRKTERSGQNDGWNNESFRSFADYTNSEDFTIGLSQLETYALQYRTAYMCSEAVPWRCHRTIISDWLTARGWHVLHIMDGNLKLHRLGTWGPKPVVQRRKVYYPVGEK